MKLTTALQRNGLRLTVVGIGLVAALTLAHAQGYPWGGGGSYYKGPGYYKGPDPYYKEPKPIGDPSDRGEMEPFKRLGGPLVAVVSVGDQRVTIYDSTGRVSLQSPVSTGSKGYETPPGVYSVVQKKPEHNSNLYQDGNMPYMQRITWTGIALHAGVLPGHPASHGCVRMPIQFAQRLFEATDVGMRVVIVPNDIAPADFDHPKLFRPQSAQVDGAGRALAYGSPEHLRMLRSLGATRATEADAASRKATEARRAADRKAAEATSATKALRAAEQAKVRAEAALKDAERDLDTANTSTAPNAAEAVKRAETAKEKATARLAEAETQVQTAKAQAQAKGHAATAGDDEAKTAETVRDAAQEASDEAKRNILPVSVFVSRKTQRLYVRQGHQPVYEAPVTIQDADRPLGTYVFTALGYAEGRPRWNLVSMYGAKSGGAEAAPVIRSAARKGEVTRREPAPADVDGAREALDRIGIPKHALQRIASVVLPGSSFIISDEGASIETGKDTDFVVIMSGEPQGGIKVRRKDPPAYAKDFFGPKYAPWGGGGGFFFSK